MKRILDYLRKLLPDLLFLFGGILICSGINEIYKPAGTIAYGCFAIVSATIWSRGGGAE